MAESLPVGSVITLRIDRDHEIEEVEARTVARIPPPEEEESESDEVKTFLENRRLGVEVASLSPERAEQLGLGPREGVEVLRLAERSPLNDKKVAKGAVIKEVDGETIFSPDEFLEAIAARKPGDKIEIRYANLDGRWHETTVRIAKPRRETRKINIPLIFGYERAPNKSSVTLPLYIFKRERIENTSKYRVLWFFTFERGAGDELLEVEN